MLDPVCVRALLDNLPRLHDICERYSQVVPQPGIH
jgi:two-component system response regulator RpfG